MEFCNVDQDLALYPNVLRLCVCKLAHPLQCEEARVTFAKVYLFIYCPAPIKRLYSPERSFVSITFFDKHESLWKLHLWCGLHCLKQIWTCIDEHSQVLSITFNTSGAECLWMLTKCFVAAAWLHAAERESLAFSKGKLFSQIVYEEWPLCKITKYKICLNLTQSLLD